MPPNALEETFERRLRQRLETLSVRATGREAAVEETVFRVPPLPSSDDTQHGEILGPTTPTRVNGCF
jgi:hypothetical protein